MTQAKRRQRTWSAFGEVRRRPSEYEVVTHATNWTLREGRKAPLEQNPSSPANLWFRAYRDESPWQVEDWDAFRDPDSMTYRSYVLHQQEQEAQVAGLLDSFASSGADERLDPAWVRTLAHLYTPTRYPLHGLQQTMAYIGLMAPSSYITNAASLAAADLLRRVTRVAYRTRELQIAHPEAGFATGERAVWETDPGWQPAREAVETALITYDWAEAFTAVTLVLLPTLDDVLLTQLGEVARDNGDHLTWLLGTNLARDAERRRRWSSALARFAIDGRPDNADTLAEWVERWTPRVDAAARGLGGLFATLPALGRSAEAVVEHAGEARAALLREVGLPVPAA